MTNLILPLANSQDELLDLVLGYVGTLHGREITPRIAGWLLELNKCNRAVARNYVSRLADAIERDEWRLTGEPIILNRDGLVNDGQHRLHAVIESGKSIITDVRFGINGDAMVATGIGKKRSAADILSIKGHVNTNMLAAAARFLYHYENGIGDYGKSISPQQVLDVIEQHPQIIQVVHRIANSKFRPLRLASIVAVMTVATEQTNMATVELFLGTVESALTTNADDPARRLHMKLTEISMQRGLTYAIDYMILTAKAWMAWLRERDIRILRTTNDERTREGFPYLRPLKQAKATAKAEVVAEIPKRKAPSTPLFAPGYVERSTRRGGRNA